MKTLLLALVLASSNLALADIEMSGPSVGPSNIGVGKAADGSFKFVDTKTQKVVGDLGLAEFKDVQVHTSWNKQGTAVEVLICHDGTHRLQRLYVTGVDGMMMSEVKFDAPDPIAACEAKSKKPFAEKANPGSDCSDLGMWTDEATAWFIAGVTKEVRAGGSTTPTSTVTLLVSFSVKVKPGGASVAIESVIGPLKDNVACERRDEFLQNWEQRNALTDSVLQ